MNTIQSSQQWDQEYENGRWDFLGSEGESARYALLANIIQVHFRRDVSLFDAGCGEGIILRHLENVNRYIGLDLSSKALERLPKSHHTRMIHSSLECYTPDETWDVVLFNEVLYYCIDPIAQIQKFETSLSGDGILIASIFIHSPRKWWKWLNRCARRVEKLFFQRYPAARKLQLIADGTTWKIFVASPNQPKDR